MKIRNFDPDKARAIVIYILNNLNNSADIHKVCCIIYVAHKELLKGYGVPLINDEFISTKDYVLPMQTYWKMNKTEFLLDNSSIFDSYEDKKEIISTDKSPDMDELSKADIKCLDFSINMIKDMNPKELVEICKDSAWRNSVIGSKLNHMDIAIASGASENTLAYIRECLEFETAMDKLSDKLSC